jgi:hypothetical protein
MSQNLKNKCSLEEEYAFEHKARIKAENYISELWGMHSELENEVSRLQKIITDNGYVKKETPPLNSRLELKQRINQIHQERKRSFQKLPKLVKGAFK